MEQLYINIRNRRQELGMTQAQLAEMVGYNDRSSIAKIEAGKVDIGIVTLIKIAHALKTEPEELLKYLWEGKEDK